MRDPKITIQHVDSVGVGAFVIGLGQISSFLSLYLHLFPAAVWSVVTRFPASGCLKCHYSSHSSSDLVTPTDRPKSVRNCCLIEHFCGVVCVVTLPF